MMMVKTKNLGVACLAAAAGTLFVAPGAWATTVAVACPGQSLQAAVSAAQGGDVINVTGTCTENISIRNDQSRLTIDGQGTAMVTGTGGSTATFNVKGKGILIKRFTINGTQSGVMVNRGANATISNNTIQNATSTGIWVGENAQATITSNIIQNNALDGIAIYESASARIGFNSATDAVASPNTIQNNGRYGIGVSRASSARIYGNTIANNGDSGVWIGRGASADIASNVVNGNGAAWVSGNGGNGIWVAQNSSVNLGESSGTSYSEMPNTTTVNNANAGLRCSMGGAIYGRLGASDQLNGTVGQFGGGTTPNTLSGSCNASFF